MIRQPLLEPLIGRSMIVAQGAQRGSFAGPPCATSVALYGIAVRVSGPTIALGVPGAMPRTTGTVDHQDLAVIGGLNVGVVALFFPAFRVFSQDRAASLFLTYPGSGQARSASRCWWRRLPGLNRRPTARGSHQAPVLPPDRAGRRRVGSGACAVQP